MHRTLLTLLSTLAMIGCQNTGPSPTPTASGVAAVAADPRAANPAPAKAADPAPATPDGSRPANGAPNPGAPNPGASNPGASNPGASREIPFTYAVTIPAPAAGTELLRVWVPVAMVEEGVQEVHDLVITAPEGYRVTTDALYGNTMVYVEVAKPTGPVTVSWSARIVRHVDHGQGTGPMKDRYVQPDRLVPTDGLALEMATRLGATDTAKPLAERTAAIYMDVLDNMTYDKKEPGWGTGSFEHATTVCKGNCTDFHARFIAIGRAAGIPVRFTMGIPLAKSEAGTHTYDSYHCWAHWHDGTSWHPVDISEADKIVDKDRNGALKLNGQLPTNKIGLTYGRDVVLEPAQAGAPLNYFVFPYAEVDGKTHEVPKGSWQFTYANR